MQISDIRKELESILELFQKYEDRGYNEFVENEILKTEWKPNSLTPLNQFQKELNAQRKNFISESAKHWAKSLYSAVRNYNKCFKSLEKPNSTYSIAADSYPISFQVYAEDSTPYGVSKIDKKEPKVKKSIMKEPIDEILLTKNKFDRLAIHIPTLKENYLCVLSVAENIKASVNTLLLCERDTLHPLPANYKFRKMQDHNLTIRTHTHHEDLLLMSEDLHRLNEIIELLNSLKVTPDRNEEDVEPGYAVRRLSTGTFELFVTTYLPMATAIAGFIFLVIREAQQAKERKLNLKLKEKELAQSEMKINSQFINDAAKILSINPNDETSKKIIRAATRRTLEYIELNPCGAINDEEYKIPETPVLKIVFINENGEE